MLHCKSCLRNYYTLSPSRTLNHELGLLAAPPGQRGHPGLLPAVLIREGTRAPGSPAASALGQGWAGPAVRAPGPVPRRGQPGGSLWALPMRSLVGPPISRPVVPSCPHRCGPSHALRPRTRGVGGEGTARGPESAVAGVAALGQPHRAAHTSPGSCGPRTGFSFLEIRTRPVSTATTCLTWIFAMV